MNLAIFPRRRYTAEKTPLQKLGRFSQRFADLTIYMKRDDCLGLACGGNKTRKLEFLVADALEKGCDTLITCGAVQSNHCRLTLSAAVQEGMHCHLVLAERADSSYEKNLSGNAFLFHLLGAEKIHVVPPGGDATAKMEEVAQTLRKQGRKPYLIPLGASNALGGLGYVACAQEILEQSFALGVAMDAVVTPSASAGTHAGLLVGFYDSGIPVIGINVMQNQKTQEALVHSLANQIAEKLRLPQISSNSVCCNEAYLGRGYGLSTPEMIGAVKAVARTEGILLDPVYTGKTMAGLIDLCNRGFFAAKRNIVFLHTGGSPALYANRELFLQD